MQTAGWLTRFCLIAALGVSLASCGGADQETDSFKQPQKGGIWHGTDPVTGQALYGIVCECGAFRFLASNGTAWTAQYVGSLTIDGGAASGTFEGFSMAGFAFNNFNEQHGNGSFGGTWQERKSMSLLVSFLADNPPVPAMAPPVSGTVNFTFDEGAYNSSVSPSGNWGAGNDTYSINGLGALFGDVKSLGCVANGSVAPSAPGHNVYDVSMELTCGGLSAGTLSGLATVDISGATQKLIVAVSSDDIVLSLTLDRI